MGIIENNQINKMDAKSDFFQYKLLGSPLAQR